MIISSTLKLNSALNNVLECYLGHNDAHNEDNARIVEFGIRQKTKKGVLMFSE